MNSNIFKELYSLIRRSFQKHPTSISIRWYSAMGKFTFCYRRNWLFFQATHRLSYLKIYRWGIWLWIRWILLHRTAGITAIQRTKPSISLTRLIYHKFGAYHWTAQWSAFKSSLFTSLQPQPHKYTKSISKPNRSLARLCKMNRAHS